ncbi:MAG TPA: serine hydrolase [Devosiaceae bacterium]|jgi:beta-lactamase class A|nr:serine hydrolase [Devosiaceae bacterium]
MTLVLAGGVARADDFTPAELVLMKLFGSDPITPEMFTANFLAQVSMPQILSVFAKTRATVGPPVSIEEAGNSYIVHTATYRIPVDIGLDPDGRVAALLLHPAVPTFATIDDVFKAIDALKGQAAYLITRNGEVLHAKSQTQPLAVSSGVKLAVLAAVADEIAAGRLAWDTIVRLGPNDISLAPGVLQTMPPGSPLTVHTLAAFMISQSDGTATDALLDLVGRDKVAREAGTDFVLKTSEFFKLKADPALRLRFTGADTSAEKLKVAADMAKMPLPNPADTGAPLDSGVEWYMPATRLCELIGKVAGLDVFVMNPGVARPNDWTQIAFKGGSEVGVASLTSALTDKAGNRYCVTMTLNDRTALDEDRLTSLYGALIDKLAGR